MQLWIVMLKHLLVAILVFLLKLQLNQTLFMCGQMYLQVAMQFLKITMLKVKHFPNQVIPHWSGLSGSLPVKVRWLEIRMSVQQH